MLGLPVFNNEVVCFLQKTFPWLFKASEMAFSHIQICHHREARGRRGGSLFVLISVDTLECLHPLSKHPCTVETSKQIQLHVDQRASFVPNAALNLKIIYRTSINFSVHAQYFEKGFSISPLEADTYHSLSHSHCLFIWSLIPVYLGQ